MIGLTTHLITGAAGFVAVNLIRRLLAAGDRVVGVDDLSRGRLEGLAQFKGSNRFEFAKVDCADTEAFDAAIGATNTVIDAVWHLAANSDIPAGVADLRIDLDRTFMTTVGTLEVMKRRNIPLLRFASSSAIYGDFGETEIHEDIGPLQPISNYGAMKLASEAQIRAAVEAWLERAEIFRFPNVIGVPATHGVILDFVVKLKADASVLPVLGNGTQQKAYLHVSDLVDAMIHIGSLDGRYLVFNIGPADDGVTVRSIAEALRDRIAPGARLAFGESNRGWVGDVPRFRYSVARLAATGWTPKLGSKAAISRAIHEIADQEIPD
jgi:UDP-glucose 4-epimerase